MQFIMWGPVYPVGIASQQRKTTNKNITIVSLLQSNLSNEPRETDSLVNKSPLWPSTEIKTDISIRMLNSEILFHWVRSARLTVVRWQKLRLPFGATDEITRCDYYNSSDKCWIILKRHRNIFIFECTSDMAHAVEILPRYSIYRESIPWLPMNWRRRGLDITSNGIRRNNSVPAAVDKVNLQSPLMSL